MSTKLQTLPSEIEDCEVFEITDFTNASDWEILTSHLEEIINDWHLNSPRRVRPINQALYPLKLHHKREKIQFRDSPFQVTFSYLTDGSPDDAPGSDCDDASVGKQLPTNTDAKDSYNSVFLQLMSDETLFPGSDIHPLLKWYGLTEFVTIHPLTGMPVKGPYRTRFLTSAVALAIANTNCQVPIFVQLEEFDRLIYQGFCELGVSVGLRTEFKVAHLKRIPHAYQSISGLVTLFQDKINLPYSANLNIAASARFTYLIRNWPASFAVNVLLNPKDNVKKGMFYLPCGVSGKDGLKGLSISVTWLNLPSQTLMDVTGTNLNPTNSSLWHLKLVYDDRPKCLLNECLRNFLQLCKRKETVRDLLRFSKSLRENNELDPALAIQRLTEAPAQRYGLHNWGRLTSHLRSHYTSPASTASAAGPQIGLSDEQLSQYLTFIFPDSLEQFLGISKIDEIAVANNMDADMRFDFLIRRLKAAPFSSLLHRLVVSVLEIYTSPCDALKEKSQDPDSSLPSSAQSRLECVAHLWYEFVMELRYRWDNGISLWKEPPKASETSKNEPDLMHCLLMQKLQMLQYCIAKRNQRHRTAAAVVVESSSNITTVSEEANDWDDEEEEFFECEDGEPMATTVSGRHPQGKAEGRDCPFGDARLLHYPDEPLYIPLCQEASGPITEDMVLQYSSQLEQLGTDSEAANQRAKMQSASLLADMQAFKAANPGCCLEDFVRWYSPRDFVENPSNKQGGLSQRMLVPGNIWSESWDLASPIPASRQKRLFDETKEGEKVLCYLEELTPAQMAIHLLPSVILEICRTLHQLEDPALPEWCNWVNKYAEFCGRTTKDHYRDYSECQEALEQIARRIIDLEYIMVVCKSLRHKFQYDGTSRGNDNKNPGYLVPLMKKLLLDGKNTECPLEGGGFGGPIRDLRPLLVAVQQSTSVNESGAPSSSNSLLDSTSSFNFAEFNINTVLPAPLCQEFVFRCMASRPSLMSSRPGPQRLYASISAAECRLVGAFTEDTVIS